MSIAEWAWTIGWSVVTVVTAVAAGRGSRVAKRLKTWYSRLIGPRGSVD